MSAAQSTPGTSLFSIHQQQQPPGSLVISLKAPIYTFLTFAKIEISQLETLKVRRTYVEEVQKLPFEACVWSRTYKCQKTHAQSCVRMVSIASTLHIKQTKTGQAHERTAVVVKTPTERVPGSSTNVPLIRPNEEGEKGLQWEVRFSFFRDLRELGAE
ncbi:hypothetical protein K435DRAFT_796696 [Dendrothele bispora CBS 962.96]|uniref:Uncharacterized protein n=1 Tax=Dendrothele bispora (strain CBS 962.96) TaxID=1314807 RepID=A0A4S8M4R6_DENBC|nr:hypothetical protein K435DRAFT_796696 [Dendrothele bispora CBS 962.96]